LRHRLLIERYYQSFRERSGLLLLDGSTEPAIHMLARGRDTKVTLIKQGSQPRVITP
jgi:hypothetical protein